MILSKSANYALRATICLAEAADGTRVRGSEIAERLDVPPNYLSKSLRELARTDLLESTRGPGGGFALARPAAELTLADVVRHFDEIPSEASCLLGRDRCSDADPCRAHTRWVTARGAVVDFLENTRLLDLTARAGRGAVAGEGAETVLAQPDPGS